LTGGIRKGAKGDPPVAIFHRLQGKGSDNFFGPYLKHGPLIFFFSSTDFLAYDRIPEEIYLSG
jgi:hypothetical protein